MAANLTQSARFAIEFKKDFRVEASRSFEREEKEEGERGSVKVFLFFVQLTQQNTIQEKVHLKRK